MQSFSFFVIRIFIRRAFALTTSNNSKDRENKSDEVDDVDTNVDDVDTNVDDDAKADTQKHVFRQCIMIDY